MFKPTDHGLEEDFRLTKYSTLRGWGCKVPQETLNRFLMGVEMIEAEGGISNKKSDGSVGKIMFKSYMLYLVKSPIMVRTSQVKKKKTNPRFD